MKMTLLNLMVMNLIQREESEEFFPDLEENESEVKNFDICDVRKTGRSICRLEAFRFLCKHVTIGCEGF